MIYVTCDWKATQVERDFFARPTSKSMSCPGALCGAPALSVSGPTLSVVSRSLCQVPALSVSGPAVSRSLCRAPALSHRGRRSLSRSPALFRCVRARGSMCRGPALSASGPALFVSRPGALCVGARRSVSGPGPANLSLSVWGLGALLLVSEPGALSLSVSGPGFLCQALALCRRSLSNLSRGPGLLLSVSDVGPGALPPLCDSCVGPQRSLGRAPTLSVSCRAQRSLSGSVSGPGALCQGPTGPEAQAPALSVKPQPVSLSVCRAPALSASSPNLCLSGQRSPAALCVGPQRSLRRAPALFVSSGPGPAISGALAQHPHGWTRAPSSDPRARRVPCFQERTPNLTVWGISDIMFISDYICWAIEY